MARAHPDVKRLRVATITLTAACAISFDKKTALAKDNEVDIPQGRGCRNLHV